MNAEGYSRRNETIEGKNIAIESYKLGDVYHVKAEIDVLGAGARIASASGKDQARAESTVIEKVRVMFSGQ
ncbi:MAG TPA: hypothetical protein VI756_31185 [Blastocatellia bacterium]